MYSQPADEKKKRQAIHISLSGNDKTAYNDFMKSINSDKSIVRKYIFMLPTIWSILAELAADENMEVLAYLKKLCLDKHRERQNRNQ